MEDPDGVGKITSEMKQAAIAYLKLMLMIDDDDIRNYNVILFDSVLCFMRLTHLHKTTCTPIW
jgi:hypothetical protein